MADHKGTPQADPEHLRKLVLELQALLIVQDCRFRALRVLVIEGLQTLKVHDLQGTPLEQVLRRMTDAELDAKLAKLSDDDPNHVSALYTVLRAARTQQQ
jgi:hypothetical protein